MKFDKSKWNEQTDPVFPSSYRILMLRDLIENHELKGISYSQLLKLVGKPDSKDGNLVSYRIIVEYGGDIDPIYTKDLRFKLLKDSLISSYEIVEWKK